MTNRWYYWVQPWKWNVAEEMSIPMDFVTVGVIFAIGLGSVYYLVYSWAKGANFLIETENELRKVTWPSHRPWFKMSTELWGASYVVIFVLCAMALVISGWDWILSSLTGWIFYE